MSNEKRVSISGNYFPDPERTEEYEEFEASNITPMAHILGIWNG